VKKIMTGYVTNIEEKTLKNMYFREVLYTTQHCQLVVMSLKPNEDIGVEVHEIVDQFIRIEKGEGKAILNGEEHSLSDGSVIIVPAGVEHNIMNTSSENELKLYTLYSPPHHKDKTVHKTKEEANADTEDHI
jgi:mannose-6-phosphate isomerase-like protein (cupin superfamily)